MIKPRIYLAEFPKYWILCSDIIQYSTTPEWFTYAHYILLSKKPTKEQARIIYDIVDSNNNLCSVKSIKVTEILL